MDRIGPYEILRKLGEGGMGVVFHARRPDLDREFALKVISAPALAADPVLRARFLREGQAAAALAGHPGIVAVHDVGEHDGTPYLAMDFVEGPAFDEILRDDAPPPRECARLIARAARAVHHAHRAGVFHRDLKPANILIEAGGTPRVADFGLARLESAGPEMTKLTESNTVVGTPAYMPPEQAMGGTVDARSDVYALGATLYDACAGGPPFDGPSIFQIISKVLREPPPPLRRRNPDVAPGLAAIVERCLEKSADDRYQTAEGLAEDLEAWLEGRPTVAQPAGPVRRLVRLARRRAGAVVAVAAVGAGLVAGGTWWALGERESGRQAEGLKRTTRELSDLELAQQLDQAWFELLRDSRGAMASLEACWYGRPATGGDRAALLATVDAAAAAAAARHPNTVLPAAWRAYAEGLSDRLIPLTALQKLAATGDPRDPFPRLLLARARLHLVTWNYLNPDLATHGRRVVVGDFQERPYTRDLRLASEADLQRALASPLWAHLRQASDVAAFAAAAHDLASQQWAPAKRKLEPLLEDPLFSASVQLMLGIARFRDGDPAGAARLWSAAARSGLVEAAPAAAGAYLLQASQADHAGDDPVPTLQRAMDLCDALRAAAPDAVPVRMAGSRVAAALAGAVDRRGEDPLPWFERARADLSHAITLEPESLFLRGHRGELFHQLAQREFDAGRDPRPLAAEALADLESLPDDHAHAGSAVTNAGLVHRLLGNAAAARGEDPFPHLDRARERLTRAITLAPDSELPIRLNRAALAIRRAELLLDRGEDPRRAVQATLDDCAAIEAGGHADPQVHFTRAGARMVLVDHAKKYGRAFHADLNQAIADYDLAIQSGPPDAGWYASRGSAFWERAHWAARNGGNPAADLAAAFDDFSAALKLKPNSLEALVNRALAGKALVQHGLAPDPAAALRAAVADLDRALAVSPGLREALYNRSLLHNQLGELALQEGRDPAPHAADALRDLNTILDRTPDYAPAWSARATLRLGVVMAQGGPRPGPAMDAILADFAKAVELDPDDWVARANRGQLLSMLGRFDAALEELERAQQLQPDNPAIRGLIEQIKIARGR